MHKFFLLTMAISTLLCADYMTESDLLIEQNLEDIKNKYHIQDEAPTEPVNADKSTPQKKQVLSKESEKIDRVTPQMKQELPKKNESAAPKKEDKLKSIRRELDIPELTGKEKRIDDIRRELKIGYEVPKKKESFLDKSVISVKKTLHMDGEIEGEYSFSNTVRDLKKTLHLDGDNSWGMPSFGLPSLFGEEKKKKDSGLFGISILGDVKDTGKSMYKGMKYSGQSAEMMSGMMYNSSKMYNTMFGMFDDSPLNIFEEEEETSMFDFIESGNSIMELFN